MASSPRRLTRPRDNRWIAGVCAGLARRFGLSPDVVRLLFVLSCLLPGPAGADLHRAVDPDARARTATATAR